MPLPTNAAARFEWKSIARGDEIPEGAVLGGRSSKDGDLFVGRNKGGEVGKLNLDKGKMWNIWCHAGKDSQTGDILIVSKGCPIQWVPVSKGGTLPPDSVHAGDFDGDGAIYPCRRGGAIGKLNLNDGKVNNLWFQGEWFAKSDGEILVVGPSGAGGEWAEQFKDASSGEARGFGSWIKDHKGGLAIAGGVVAAAAAGVGIAAAAGAFSKSDDKPPVAGDDKPPAVPADSGYAPGDQPPEALPTQHHEDPKNYNENAMCDGIKAAERVDWLVKEQGLAHEDAVKQVMKEFPDVFKDWWKPHADCDGNQAQERAQWLVDNKGMSMNDAKKQVRDEFPSVFGAGGTASKGHYVDGKFPHTLSVEDTADGPKLKFAVTPRDKPEEQVSLVAFHYQINQGAPMNFDVKTPQGNTYVHQTPGASFPTCPRGSEVSYWLAVKVQVEVEVEGIGKMEADRIDEEPNGACTQPDRRMYWTAK